MRYVEIRRHTMRTKPGQYLSQAGVEMARRQGDRMGPFNYVITSPVPRAYETAIAMGFAVDAQEELLSTLGPAVSAEVEWPAPFAHYAQAINRQGATAHFAQRQVDLWQAASEALPDGGCALIISHGGIVEIGAVACLPQADHAAWGSACGYCEGVRLGFSSGCCVEAHILRVEGSTVT